MRHGDKVNNLGRTAAHRRAMLANMAISLIEHKRIVTTLAKAKALRQFAEPLITKCRENTTHSRRVVFSYLQNKDAIKELFSTVAEKIGERPGGYLRVIKLGFRRGDGADTAMIEFVDFNETYNPNAGKTKTTKKTRRGSAKKSAASPAEALAEASTPGAIVPEPQTPVIESAEAEEEANFAASDSVDEVIERAPDAPAPIEEPTTEEPAAEIEEPPAAEEAPITAQADETVAATEEEPIAAAEETTEPGNEEEKKEDEQA